MCNHLEVFDAIIELFYSLLQFFKFPIIFYIIAKFMAERFLINQAKLSKIIECHMIDTTYHVEFTSSMTVETNVQVLLYFSEETPLHSKHFLFCNRACDVRFRKIQKPSY